MPHPLYPFICWWHLGCSHFLAVVNNTAVNVGARVSESLLSICSSFDYIPTSLIAGSGGNSMFSVWGTTKLFSTVPSPFYIPTRNVWEIQFCREPARDIPLETKVMRKEARHTQRQDRASGVPPDILEHLPPKTRVCLLYCFVLSPLTLLGAVPHHHLALSVKELTYSSN